MINWKTSLIAIGALIVLPLSVYAVRPDLEADSIQEFRHGSHLAQRMKHGKRGRHLEKIIQELDLSAEQTEQVRAIQAESKTAAAEIEQQMRSQHGEMKSLLASDASTEEIRIQYREVRSLRQRMGDNRFETMLQIREVLNPEQRVKLTQIIEQHRGRDFRDR